jgi:hypothetical protein
MKFRLRTNGEKWKIQRSRLGAFWLDCDQFGLCIGEGVGLYPSKGQARLKMDEFNREIAFWRGPWRAA